MGVDLRVLANHNLNFRIPGLALKHFHQSLGERVQIVEGPEEVSNQLDLQKGPEDFQVFLNKPYSIRRYKAQKEILLPTNYRHIPTIHLYKKVIAFDEKGLGRYHRFMEVMLSKAWSPRMTSIDQENYQVLKEGVNEYRDVIRSIVEKIGGNQILYLDDLEFPNALRDAADGAELSDLITGSLTTSFPCRDIVDYQNNDTVWTFETI